MRPIGPGRQTHPQSPPHTLNLVPTTPHDPAVSEPACPTLQLPPTSVDIWSSNVVLDSPRVLHDGDNEGREFVFVLGLSFRSPPVEFQYISPMCWIIFCYVSLRPPQARMDPWTSAGV